MFSRRKKLSLVLPLLVLGGMLLSGCSLFHHVVKKPVADNKSIVILYENDVHCILDGYPLVAGLYDAISDTAYVKLVSSGDFMSGGTLGAMSKGQYVMDVMKTLPYDAITFGNHEFDFRVPRLKELMNGLEDRLTCVNLVDKTNGELVYNEMVMTEAGNHKIAFIGVTTPSTLSTMPTAFVDDAGKQIYDLVPTEIYSRMQKAVDKARRQGAEYVFVLSHLGEGIEREFGIDSHGLVAATSGIDAVLDGHSHSLIRCDMVKNKSGIEVPVTQTGTQMKNIGKLVILPNGKFDFSVPEMSGIHESNGNVASAVGRIKAVADSITNRVVAHSDIDLKIKVDGREISRTQETNTTNLVTDAYRIQTGADVVIMNAGGIRNAIKAGDLKYGDLVSLLPYDNYMSTVEVTGAQILRAIELNVKALPHPDGQFPVVSGMRYTVSASTHVVSNVEVLDKETGEYRPLDLDRTYVLTSTTYAIYEGGLHQALVDAKPIKKNFAHYCDAFIDYITQTLGGHITAEDYGHLEGRITVTE